MRRLFAVLLLAAAVALAAAYVQTLRSPTALDDLALRDLSVEGRHDHRVGVTLRASRAGGSRPGPVRVILKSSWGTRELGATVLAPGEQKTLTWRSPPVASGDHLVTAWIRSDDSRLDADESNNARSELVRVEGGPPVRATSIARVPDLRGRSRAVAAALLRRSGFRVGNTYEHATGEPTGVVERQWPAPGGAAPRGTAATLVMGALVSVPRLAGLPLDQARTVLRRRDLEVGPLELRYAGSSERGGVLAQNPRPGARIALRTGVRLTLAQPAPAWPVPVALALALIGLTVLVTGPRRRELPPPIGRGSAPVGPDPNEAHERFMPRPVESEPAPPLSLVPPTSEDATNRAEVGADPEIATLEAPVPIEAPPPTTESNAEFATLEAPDRSVSINEPRIEPAFEPRSIEPVFVPRPIEPPRWEQHPDAGQQQVTWHPETAQPTISFELVTDSYEARVDTSQNARSESA